MPRKGADFEREVARTLSRWWSGKEDDLFWRASQSGGRATQRSRKGKRTAGHYGDMAATTAEGAALIKNVTIEIKRGYNKATLLDFIEMDQCTSPSLFPSFVKQAQDAAQRAGTPHWWVIHRRDNRQHMIYFPKEFWHSLSPSPSRPIAAIWIRYKRFTIVGMRLELFLEIVNPRFLQNGENDGQLRTAARR